MASVMLWNFGISSFGPLESPGSQGLPGIGWRSLVHPASSKSWRSVSSHSNLEFPCGPDSNLTDFYCILSRKESKNHTTNATLNQSIQLWPKEHAGHPAASGHGYPLGSHAADPQFLRPFRKGTAGREGGSLVVKSLERCVNWHCIATLCNVCNVIYSFLEEVHLGHRHIFPVLGFGGSTVHTQSRSFARNRFESLWHPIILFSSPVRGYQWVSTILDRIARRASISWKPTMCIPRREHNWGVLSGTPMGGRWIRKLPRLGSI